MTGYVTEFTTYFGTHLQGMWPTWKNTAVVGGTIDATTTLTVDLDIMLYTLDLSTATNQALDKATATYQFLFYF